MEVIESPYSLREKFIEQVVKPLRIKKPYEKPDESIIEIRLKNKDVHFFERVIEREIDKGRLGTVFKSLINDNYCELLYLFHKSRMDYDLNMIKPFILVTYKDLNVIFMMIDAHDREKYKRWELVPITILKDNDNFVYSYRIDI